MQTIPRSSFGMLMFWN